jgi:predicted ATP-grasp superfamily ATP-dependent carboligase
MASSAARAGFQVFAADLFGDHDLRAVATEVTTVPTYPDGILEAVARFPKAPVLYTGALENHPSLIAQLAARRPLAACGAEAVTRVRDTLPLARAVREARLFFPETRTDSEGIPVDGTWLVKPVASAGGRGIRPWFGLDAEGPSRLWQRRVSGQRLSVGYLLKAGQSRLIATSRQLIGCRWCGAGRFAYCGSIDLDRATLDTNVASQLARLGELLAGHFALRGLVGADLVIDARQRAWVIEVNPRPTASMELIERATGCSLAAMHVEAFGFDSPGRAEPHERTGTWAKAVLFARHDGTFEEGTLESVATRASAWTREDGWPAVADIPEPSCPILSGAPVCTIFARGASPRAALRSLRDRVATIEQAVVGR